MTPKWGKNKQAGSKKNKQQAFLQPGEHTGEWSTIQETDDVLGRLSIAARRDARRIKSMITFLDARQLLRWAKMLLAVSIQRDVFPSRNWEPTKGQLIFSPIQKPQGHAANVQTEQLRAPFSDATRIQICSSLSIRCPCLPADSH